MIMPRHPPYSLAASGAAQLRAAGLLCTCLFLLALIETSFSVPAVLSPSLAASAVLLVTLPSSPAARPWPLVGGTLLSALVAVLISRLPLPLWIAIPLAGGLALVGMYRLGCLHPPAAAMVPWVLLSSDFRGDPWLSLLACLPGLFMLALLSQWQLRAQAAPVAAQPLHRTEDPPPTRRHAPTRKDWQQALDSHPELLDIPADKLQELYRDVELNRLRLGTHVLRVRDIMSKSLITLAPGDSARQAWRCLQRHRIKTIPVVSQNKVVGIVSLVDLLKFLGLSSEKLSAELNTRANLVLQQEVATVMSKPASCVRDDLPLGELVPLFADNGLHRLPVVDEEACLVGMVTQSDLIAALAHLLSYSVEQGTGLSSENAG